MDRQKLYVTREKLEKLLAEQDGRFFTVIFKKKDNTYRKLNGRLGVTKYLKGGRSYGSGYDNPYEIVFDVQNRGYRSVNLHTIVGIKANNVNYYVKG